MHAKYILPGMIGFVIIILFFSQSIVSTVAAENENEYSTIAGIKITAEKESDIKALVATEINEWKMQPLIVQGETAVIEIDAKYIHFDLTKAVDQFVEAKKSPWYKPWSKEATIDIPLDVTLSEEVKNSLKNAPLIKVDETMEAIQAHASLLKKTEVEAKEIPISKESLTRMSFEIHEISGQGTVLNALVNELNDFTLRPGETFSFLNIFEAQQLADKEAVNFFASVLYSVVLQADVSVLERHSQHILPNYLQPGIEVEVSERLHRDFVFKNESSSPMIFSSTVENNNLLIELYTLESDKTITYSVNKKEVEPRTIYRLSSKVRLGTEKVLQEGESGYLVTVNRKTVDKGIETEDQMSRDFYPPKHKIVLVSSEKPVQTEINEADEQEVVNTGESAESNNEMNHQQTPEDNRPTKKEREDDDVEGPPAEEVIYDKGGNVITDQDD